MPYLRDLAVRGEENPGEWIGKATAVRGKQAAGLVHVDSELKHLLHCWTDKKNCRVGNLLQKDKLINSSPKAYLGVYLTLILNLNYCEN